MVRFGASKGVFHAIPMRLCIFVFGQMGGGSDIRIFRGFPRYSCDIIAISRDMSAVKAIILPLL